MRRWSWAALVALTFSACGVDIDLAPDLGYHDFSWNLSMYDVQHRNEQPYTMMWGWVQNRPRRHGYNETLYAICALSQITGLQGHPQMDEDKHNKFVGYRGHSFQIKTSRKAVYALQEDGSLQEIALSADEVNQALAMLDDPREFYATVDPPRTPVFRDKIIPQLKTIQLPAQKQNSISALGSP